MPFATGTSASEADNTTAVELTAAEDAPVAVAVEIPQIDDEELSSFFITSASVSHYLDQQEKEEADVDTFNDIFIDSNDMYDMIQCCSFLFC